MCFYQDLFGFHLAKQLGTFLWFPRNCSHWRRLLWQRSRLGGGRICQSFFGALQILCYRPWKVDRDFKLFPKWSHHLWIKLLQGLWSRWFHFVVPSCFMALILPLRALAVKRLERNRDACAWPVLQSHCLLNFQCWQHRKRYKEM